MLGLLLLLAANLGTPALAGEVPFDEEGHAENPVWSANGKWLAFEVNDGSSVDMQISAVQGAVATKGASIHLPGGGSSFDAASVVTNPTWHDQGFVVFEGSHHGGRQRLYVYNPGGASATELLSPRQAPGNLTFPAISPDGMAVAFINDASGNPELRLWERERNRVVRLTDTPAVEGYPAYAADGKSISFDRTDGDGDIVLIDLASRVETVVAGSDASEIRPAWAAEGQLVWFRSEAEDVWDIVVGAPGEPERVLARDVRLPTRARPALTPDGAWVAWVAGAGGSVVNLTALDGSAEIAIQTDKFSLAEPALAMQGDELLLAYTWLEGADWRRLFVMRISDAVLGEVAAADGDVKVRVRGVQRPETSAPATGAVTEADDAGRGGADGPPDDESGKDAVAIPSTPIRFGCGGPTSGDTTGSDASIVGGLSWLLFLLLGFVLGVITTLVLRRDR